MNKILPLLAFSILLLVPVVAQQAFANHPQLVCPPPGILIAGTAFFPSPICISNLDSRSSPPLSCPPGYSNFVLIDPATGVIYNACIVTPGSFQDPTLPDQCQDKATLVGNHCVPDLSQVCGSGTIPQNLMCFAQSMGSMIGGTLANINTVSLLVGAIGTNPIITGLVGITLAGVAGQAVWFVHRRKKK